MTIGAMPGEGDAIAQPRLLGQRHDRQTLDIADPLLHEICPQDGGALHHATLHHGIDGKEVGLGIGIHPSQRAAIEDDDIRPLYGIRENKRQPEIIEPHLACQLAQQGHYGAFIAGPVKLGDEI
ncbi:hypothetical protein D3C79_512100 [compost metagenome]